MTETSCEHRNSVGPIRIVLLYAWGNGNAGDKALALGTVESLRSCLPSAVVHVVSLYKAGHDEFEASHRYITARYPDVHVIPDDLGGRRKATDPRLRELTHRSMVAFGLLCPPLLRFVCRKSAVFAALERADIVLLNGGHLLFWSDRMGQKHKIVGKYLLPLMVARRLGKFYGLHAQSYGPFEFTKKDCLFRWMFRHVLMGARYLSVRESASLPHLKTCIDNTDRVKRVLDSAFFLTKRDEGGAALLLEQHGLAPKHFLALTLRLSKRGSQKNLPPEAHESYGRKIADFVSLWTRNQPFPIACVCQVPKDVEDAKFILSKLSREERDRCIVLEHTASPELLIALYANARAVVGMRFHSLIFALLANAPVMGVYYYDIGPKIRGIMDDLGQPEYALSLEQTSGLELYESASKLSADADRMSRELADRVSALRKATLMMITDQIAASRELPASRVHPNAGERSLPSPGRFQSVETPHSLHSDE